jgi:hypothetical protein
MRSGQQHRVGVCFLLQKAPGSGATTALHALLHDMRLRFTDATTEVDNFRTPQWKPSRVCDQLVTASHAELGARVLELAAAAAKQQSVLLFDDVDCLSLEMGSIAKALTNKCGARQQPAVVLFVANTPLDSATYRALVPLCKGRRFFWDAVSETDAVRIARQFINCAAGGTGAASHARPWAAQAALLAPRAQDRLQALVRAVHCDLSALWVRLTCPLAGIAAEGTAQDVPHELFQDHERIATRRGVTDVSTTAAHIAFVEGAMCCDGVGMHVEMFLNQLAALRPNVDHAPTRTSPQQQLVVLSNLLSAASLSDVSERCTTTFQPLFETVALSASLLDRAVVGTGLAAATRRRRRLPNAFPYQLQRLSGRIHVQQGTDSGRAIAAVTRPAGMDTTDGTARGPRCDALATVSVLTSSSVDHCGQTNWFLPCNSRFK